ncbi:hypothetical protein BH10ACT8_BH10ACT8_18080 [soil metagenome]
MVGSDTGWMTQALEAIRALAATGRDFTADDIRAEPYKVSAPESPGRVGAAFRVADSNGWIERVGYAQSTTASRKSSTLATWRGR